MKVLLPIIDQGANSNELASGFFETKDVCVYDLNKSSLEHMSIEELGSNMRNLPNALREREIESIISSNMRPMALQIFMRCGVKVYEAIAPTIEKNVEMLRMGKLAMYSMESSREHLSACGGSCSSCSSTSCK